MALELESKIMTEIGLGNHYNWYNGSPSCRYVRTEAVNRLFDIIQRHFDCGEEIAAPNFNLIETLKRIAAEGDDCDLTKTWEGASYIIAEHIHQAHASEEERIEAFENLDKYLKDNYLQKEIYPELSAQIKFVGDVAFLRR